MSIEGQLTIHLKRDDAGQCRAEITSTRPQGIARLFRGKTGHQTLETIPLLFSICAKAQSSAAVQALERAGGLEVADATRSARQLVVLAETAREHVLRIALDWPAFISGETARIDARPLMRLPEEMMRALFEAGRAFHMGAEPAIDHARAEALIEELEVFLAGDIFGEPVPVWRDRVNVDDVIMWSREAKTIPARLMGEVLDRGWAAAGAVQVPALPALTDTELLAGFDIGGGDLGAAPKGWDTPPAETSCLTRQNDTVLVQALAAEYGGGLAARLAARLTELARLPGEMRDLLKRSMEATAPMSRAGGEPAPDGRGVAQVEAARGRLVHMAALKDARVQDYRILAPTEWNFHPQGPAALSLGRLAGPDEGALKAQAGLLISAIDPCVGYEVKLV